MIRSPQICAADTLILNGIQRTETALWTRSLEEALGRVGSLIMRPLKLNN